MAELSFGPDGYTLTSWPSRRSVARAASGTSCCSRWAWPWRCRPPSGSPRALASSTGCAPPSSPRSEQRLDSHVELQHISIELGPVTRISGGPLTIRHRSRLDVAPLVHLDRFETTMTWRELLRRPRRVDTVILTGLAIAIPPSPGEGQPRFPKADETRAPVVGKGRRGRRRARRRDRAFPRPRHVALGGYVAPGRVALARPTSRRP